MRWKLLIAASLAATAAGAGASLALAHFLLGSTRGVAPTGLAASATLLAPLAAITYASIFVYRHTARRRTLQAMATALLSLFLTLGALFAGSVFLARPAPEVTPAPGRDFLRESTQHK